VKPPLAKPQAAADVPAKPQAAADVLAKPQAAKPAGFTPPQQPEPPPVEAQGRWSSLMASVLGRWLVLGASPVLGLALVLGVWAVVHRGASPPGLPDQGPDAAASGPAQPAESAQPQAAGFAGPDRRWLPDETRLVAVVRGSSLAAQPQARQLLGPLASWWRPSVGALVEGLGLRLDKVRRITWAATDLAAGPDCGVAVVELEEGQDAAKLLAGGQPVDGLKVGSVAFRCVASGPWPHPFAALEPRLVVTGSEPLLRALVARSEPRLASAAVERLLKTVSFDADAVLVLDLAAARAAHWRLPAAILDVWPAAGRAWHVLWEVPDGLGCAVQWSGPVRSQLALACDSERSAERVRAAVEELIPATVGGLEARLESLKRPGGWAGVGPEAADAYATLLGEAQAALQTARCDAADAVVCVWMNWGRGPLAAAAAAAEGSTAIYADWLAAGRAADETRHRRLAAGLGQHAKAEKGSLPPGAAGGSMMPPETQLSWIAALLPFFGHPDWKGQLQFGYNWNDPRNLAVTRRPLPEVTNPVLGPGTSPAGFPVTHYVGVAGLGADAAGLRADDPRAGVFGFGRTTRLEDITRGTANTIAILGVTEHCGPWAAGGEATVRGLTKPPYFHGPDGFGSGQPDGMWAGMADGSVRFLSKDLDPHVLEGMATIHGEPAKPQAEGPAKPQAETPAKPQAEAPAKPPAEAPAKPPAAEARLNEPIPQITLPGVPLRQAVDLLAGMSSVPVSFDADALAELGVTLGDPVSVELAQATVGKALQAVAASRGLVCVVLGGQVLLTSPAEHRQALGRLRYTVADLTGQDAAAAAELARLVQRFVAPQSWQRFGGQGTIEVQGDVLAIEQTPSVHGQILAFCERLRLARGMPLRSKQGRQNPGLFTLATRLDRAKAALEHPITVNLSAPLPLGEALARIRPPGGVELIVDWWSLAAVAMADDAKAALKVEKQPLRTALGQLLDPLGLAWRVVTPEMIQVSTPKAIAARLEIEFYPVGRLLAKEQPAALIERIKGRLGGATWGEGGGGGALEFDPPSRCLICLQSQPVEIALEALLSEKQ
jgi:hypothetical protein